MLKRVHTFGLCAVLALAAVSDALAQGVTQPFTFQGFLRQSGLPVTSSVSMEFRIYATATGGTALWSSGTLSVSVSNGLFTVVLTPPVSVWTGGDRYLEIQINPPGGPTLSPRVLLMAAPYANTATLLNMFQSGVNNPNRMVITHSPPFQDWGLQYRDVGDSFHFLGAGVTVLRIGLGDGNVGVGVESPEYLLDVRGNRNARLMNIVNANTDATADGLHITVAGSAAWGLNSVASGSDGIAVRGVATGANGRAVRGLAENPGAWAAYFTGRGYFEYNSTIDNATLRLHELGSDFARLEFSSTTAARRWHIAGFIGSAVGADRLNLWNSQTGDIVSLSGDGSVAVGTPLLYSARLNVTANSTIDRATLRLHETEGTDVARLEFTNANPARKWHIAGSIGSGGVDTDRISIWNSSSGDLLWISGNGNVGIGTTNPEHRLHTVTAGGTRVIFAHHTAPSGGTYGVYGQSDSSVGTGVYGLVTANTGSAWGVWGRTSSSASSAYGVVGEEPSDGAGHAVYASGTLAATGTKSFQIDHPLRPETHYLNHFCAEGPEPYNIYSGVVVLDARGEAWVQLPDYFEAINRDPRYTLTPIGAPMPNLHIAVKIQNNRFKIAGGVPGMEVSWEVKAIRNDLWVQRYGYQTEQEKEDEIKGKYLHPELYGQPKERGILYRPEPAAQPSPSGKR
ncbi:MAG: hypothetical protein RMJ83_10005 [Armatimonadota bacterium]|nr:hypothetical protein [Armatimonadota bacterium]